MQNHDFADAGAGLRGAVVVLVRGSGVWTDEWLQRNVATVGEASGTAMAAGAGQSIVAGHSGRGDIVRVDALPWEHDEEGIVWRRVLARCGRPAHAEVPVGTTVVVANAGAADPASLRRLLSWAHSDTRSALVLTMPDNAPPVPDWADTAVTQHVDEPEVCLDELVQAAAEAGSTTPRIQARRALRRSGGVGRYARALVAEATTSRPGDVPALVDREVAATLQGLRPDLVDVIGLAAVLSAATLRDITAALAALDQGSDPTPVPPGQPGHSDGREPTAPATSFTRTRPSPEEPAGTVVREPDAPIISPDPTPVSPRAPEGTDGREPPAPGESSGSVHAAVTRAAPDDGRPDQVPERLVEAARTGLVRLQVAEAGPWRLRIAPVVAEAVLRWAGFARAERWHRAAARVSGADTRLLHEAAVVLGADEALSDELVATAGRLEAGGALRAAASHLAAAARLAVDEQRAGSLLTKAANAVVGSGDLVAAADYLPAVRVLPVTPEREAVLGYHALSLGDSALAEHHLIGAWRSINPRLDPAVAGAISARMVLHELGEWDGPRMEVWAERALSVAEPGSAPWWEAASMAGLAHAVAGHTREADETCNRLVAEADSPLVLARAQLGLGWVKLLQGDLTGARVTLQSCADLSAAGGSLRVRIWALAWHAYAEFLLGHWDHVLALTTLADRLVEETGLDLLRPLVAWPAVSVLAHRGDSERARAVLEAATVEARSYTVQIIPAALAAAEISNAEGRFEETVVHLAPLLELPRGRDSRLWMWQHTLARALVRLGRDAEAEQIMASLAQEGGEDPLSASMTVSLRAQLLARCGDLEQAERQFDDSLDMAGQVGAQFIRTRILHARGETLRRAGQRSRAAAVLTDARSGYANLGASRGVERCDGELRLLTPRDGGGQPGRAAGEPAQAVASAVAKPAASGDLPSSSTLRDLTEREREVTRLVAGGLTNKEVGAQLFCSVKTVQYHLTRVYAKLGVRSRSELAALVASLPAGRDQPDLTPSNP